MIGKLAVGLAVLVVIFVGIMSLNNAGVFEPECRTDSDCVPASCCHPDSCVVSSQAPDCSRVFCTEECRGGTMDCGQGRCSCVNGMCQAVMTQSPIGLPNPASVYCGKQGHELEIRTEENGGQYGVCMFPDGTECEEWEFFNGECSPGMHNEVLR